MEIDLTKFSKIAISGVHGNGKTTLAKKMSEEFGLTYVDEVARSIIEKTEGFDWRSAGSKEVLLFEWAIFYTHRFYVSFYEKNKKAFVSDRSLIDIMSYSKWHFDRTKNAKFLDIIGACELNLKSGNLYDVILHYNDGYKSDFTEICKYIQSDIKSTCRIVRGWNCVSIITINKDDVIKYKNKKIKI